MDFEHILTDYNVPYVTEGHHHARDGWINIDCPFCGKGTHSYHMGYNIAFGYANCWRCGTHPLVNVLHELTGLSIGDCVKLLKQIKVHKAKVVEKHKGVYKPPKLGGLKKAHIAYLHNRGYDHKKLVRLWNIDGISLSSKYAWRIFIPVLYHGKAVSWSTRSISKDKAVTRYLSAPLTEESMRRTDLLYGEDYAKNTIIICEGFFDVWSLGPGAVATMGVEYSTSQLMRMVNFKKRYVCFDSDEPGQDRAKKLCRTLSLYEGETHNILLDSKDAGEASKKEIKLLQKLLL